MRKRNLRTQPERPLHRINHHIRAATIRVIGPDGAQLGIMVPQDAYRIAQESGLDLVEVAPQARPPVCRILDYGKFRYQQSKKTSSSKSARIQVKELRLRPKTDTHDLQTILKRARSFLEKGHRVKIVLRMRGREQAHPRLWVEKVREVIKMLEDISTVTQSPRPEGRLITATLEPIRES